MQLGPGNAILELCKSEKVSAQFKVCQLLVISLYGITKSVSDPLKSRVQLTMGVGWTRYEAESGARYFIAIFVSIYLGTY